MNLNRIAIACVAPLALTLATVSAPAQAAPAGASEFDHAVLGQLDAPTRAEVERRATGGNTVTGVVGTILLNNYYKAGARKPGTALRVIAVDFALGHVVFERGPNLFEVQRFDPRTLRILR